VVEPGDPLITATAVVDDATGAFTVDPAAFDFPQYRFSSPAPGMIDVILNAPARGQIDLRTGKAINLPATEPVPIYPCTVDGHDVIVDVASPITDNS